MADEIVKQVRSVAKLTKEGNYAGALWYAEKAVEELRSLIVQVELGSEPEEEEDG